MIVGGVTKVIPLTGVTLPFVSYGGSSIVANFVLLALLLLVSDRARRPARRAMNTPVLRLFVLVVVLFGVLVAFTSRWTVFDAEALRDNALNRRALLAGAADQARHDPRAPTARCSRARCAGPATRYTRRYPDRRRCSPTRSATRSRRSAAPGSSARATTQLTGRRTELVTAFESILGRANEGDDVHTTLDAKAQQAAVDALRRPATRARSSRSTSRPAACS